MKTLRIMHRNEYESPALHGKVVDFLFHHLDEFGDSQAYISKSLDYAFSPAEGKGGLVTLLEVDGQLTGVAIVNHTGMGGYIPEEQLVYIAIHKHFRKRGLGKTLLQFTLENLSGAVALHVEPHNPARKLYESLGFTSKYLEMRRPEGEIIG